MKKLFLISVLASLLISQSSCKKMLTSLSGQSQPNNSKAFTMYSAMQYQNMPDLSTIGMEPVTLINETSIFTSTTDLSPDSNKVMTTAQQLGNNSNAPVIFDIEKWSYSTNQLPNTISWFLDVINVFKEYSSASMGFYGVVPNDAYTWTNIEPTGGSNYVQWQTLNSALTPIADRVDLFFPSFYTFNDDTVSWNNYVTATLSEFRRYNVNKPVYAFLWPQYHDGEPNQYQFVDTSVWRYELETLYPLVDGVVIWSSSKSLPGVSNVWDNTWPWWTTTQQFMTEHNIQ